MFLSMNQNRLRKERQKSTTPDWQSSFIEMWKESMEQHNARFERSAEMFHVAQSKNATVDIFKDLASK